MACHPDAVLAELQEWLYYMVAECRQGINARLCKDVVPSPTADLISLTFSTMNLSVFSSFALISLIIF